MLAAKEWVMVLSLSATLVATGCARALATSEAELFQSIRSLESPAAPRSGQPNLSVGPGGVVYLSWIERAGDGPYALRFSSHKPGSDGWSEPRTIAEGKNWFVNWADFPSLAVDSKGNLFAHWLARNGTDTYAYGVQMSRSPDGGKTWSSPRLLHDDNSPTEHGFASLIPMGEGGTLAVWLDGRNFAKDVQEMTLRARMLRPDGSQGAETVADELVCDCCQTSGVGLPGGKALVVYRDRTRDEIRDISAVRFENGAWSDPISVHADGWRIPGCPINGPSVDAQGERVVVAWFASIEGKPRVQASFSPDGGRTFGKAIRVDQSHSIGRVDTAMLDDGSALISWVGSEAEGSKMALLVRRVDPDGATGPVIRIEDMSESRASGFPRLVRSGSEIIFAWTGAGDASQVRTAAARWR